MKEKSHNKKKEVKALIIRDILQRELSGQDLGKSEIEKDMKDLGIPKPNFEFHLYSRKKHQDGLIPKKVIKSKKGNLSLNLNNLNSLAIIFDYLVNDPVYGEKVRYLLDRAFVEAFYSEYGDMLVNEWKLVKFLFSKLEIRLLNEGVDPSEIKEIRSHIFNEFLYRISRYNKSSFSGMDHASVSWDKINPKIDHLLNKIELLSLLIEFSRSLRVDDSVQFKISYIIKAIEKSEWARELKTKNDERLELLIIPDLSLLSLDNDKIMDMSDSDENTFKIFIDKVVKKVFDENVKIDKSLKPDFSVLELFVFPELQNQASRVNVTITLILNGFLFPPHSKSREGYGTLSKKRKELGFKDENIFL